jgi:hypothetical protein
VTRKQFRTALKNAPPGRGGASKWITANCLLEEYSHPEFLRSAANRGSEENSHMTISFSSEAQSESFGRCSLF